MIGSQLTGVPGARGPRCWKSAVSAPWAPKMSRNPGMAPPNGGSTSGPQQADSRLLPELEAPIEESQGHADAAKHARYERCNHRAVYYAISGCSAAEHRGPEIRHGIELTQRVESPIGADDTPTGQSISTLT